ncbi:MAG: hypothetical protein HY663_06770 [Chloroflexi bacterium]|nr:hypothetical protein [Chloroflexota bacterium]
MDTQPAYEELVKKVLEYETQEQVFRSVIQHTETLYAEVAKSQTEIENKNREIEEKRR